MKATQVQATWGFRGKQRRKKVSKGKGKDQCLILLEAFITGIIGGFSKYDFVYLMLHLEQNYKGPNQELIL